MTMSGHSLWKKKRKARRVSGLALMSADTPAPTDGLQLVQQAGKAEQEQERGKRRGMFKKQ